MPTALIGSCSAPVTGTFTAQATANGASKSEALARAREQAQTLLDAQLEALPTCPAQCPVKDVAADPDYDFAAPVYAVSPEAPSVFLCTASVARLVILTCGSDGSANPPAGGSPGGGSAGTGPG